MAAADRRYPPGSGPADDAWLDVLAGADPEALINSAEADEPPDGESGLRASRRALRQAQALRDFHAQAEDEAAEAGLAAGAGLRIAGRLQAGLSAHRGGAASRIGYVPPPAVIDPDLALADADHVDLGDDRVDEVPAAPLFEPVQPTWATPSTTTSAATSAATSSGVSDSTSASRAVARSAAAGNTPNPWLQPLSPGPADDGASAHPGASPEFLHAPDRPAARPVWAEGTDTGPDTLAYPAAEVDPAADLVLDAAAHAQGADPAGIDIALDGSAWVEPQASLRASVGEGAWAGNSTAVPAAGETWHGVAGGLNPGESRRGTTSLHPLATAADTPSGLWRKRRARALGWRVAGGLAMLGGLLIGGLYWLDPAGWRGEAGDGAGGPALAGGSTVQGQATPGVAGNPGLPSATTSTSPSGQEPRSRPPQGLDGDQALAEAGLARGGPATARATETPAQAAAAGPTLADAAASAAATSTIAAATKSAGRGAAVADRGSANAAALATAASRRAEPAGAERGTVASAPPAVLAAVPAASVARLREVPPLPQTNPVAAIAARRAATLHPPSTLATTVDVVEPAPQPGETTQATTAAAAAAAELAAQARSRSGSARTEPAEAAEAERERPREGGGREAGGSRRAGPPPPVLATPVPATRAPLAGVLGGQTAAALASPPSPPSPAGQTSTRSTGAGPSPSPSAAEAQVSRRPANDGAAAAAAPAVAPPTAAAPSTVAAPSAAATAQTSQVAQGAQGAQAALATPGSAAAAGAASARPTVRPVWAVPRPQEALDRLRALCSLHDVKLVQRRVGEVWWLDAEVPAAQRSALQPGLTELGLTLPPDGRLRLRLERAP